MVEVNAKARQPLTYNFSRCIACDMPLELMVENCVQSIEEIEVGRTEFWLASIDHVYTCQAMFENQSRQAMQIHRP